MDTCIITELRTTIHQMSNKHNATFFNNRVKMYFGVSSLSGLPEHEQVKKMNEFWKQFLEPIPNTTFIRSWLTPCNSVAEYVHLFYHNWGIEVINLGVLHK